MFKASNLNKVTRRVRLQDLPVGETYTLLDCEIIPSKYGVDLPTTLKEVDTPVYLPQYLSNDVEQIMSDGAEEMKSGHVGFTVREYKNSYGTFKGLEWVDL